jgi:acyl carrier protein
MSSNPEDNRYRSISEIHPNQTGIYEEQSPTSAEVQEWLVSKFAEVLGVESTTVDVHEPTTSYGLGSVQLLSLVGELEDWLDRRFPGTLLWDYPTLHEVAVAVAEGEVLEPSA